MPASIPSNPANPVNPATLADPLADLRDWHLPDPVSWWPPAPGWWLVAGLTLAAGMIALVWWLRRRRRFAAARAALSELVRLRTRLAVEGDARQYAAAVSALLRRLALARYPREQVAGLTGSEWLAFLDGSGGGGRFSQGPGRILADVPYDNPDGAPADGVEARREPAPDSAGLTQLAADWIRANRGPVS